MSDESTEIRDEGLATLEILKRWLAFESITLSDAALIAHGASPDAGGLGLSEDRSRAIADTHDVLSRSTRLRPPKVVDDQELHETSDVFRTLWTGGHRFPEIVGVMLLKMHVVHSGTQVQRQRHSHAERYGDDRIQVMRAMIQVLADPTLHPTCRRDGGVEGTFVGIDLARTIIANEERLFEARKSPQKARTVAKLFNKITGPKVN